LNHGPRRLPRQRRRIARVWTSVRGDETGVQADGERVAFVVRVAENKAPSVVTVAARRSMGTTLSGGFEVRHSSW